MPRTDKEGKVLQLPECFSTFAQMDSMIAKLNTEDFKPGATVAWMSDPHHDRPELWTLIVDVDPERVVNGHWQPICVRASDGGKLWAHPREFIVINMVPYNPRYRVERYLNLKWE